jgi:hypothetical protein
MKKSYCLRNPSAGIFGSLLTLILLLHGFMASAQEAISPIHPGYLNSFNCYPNGLPYSQRTAPATAAPVPGTASAAIGGPTTPGPTGPTTPLSPSSYNGVCLTPKGTLKVLVVYAGFTNDNVPPVPGFPSQSPIFGNNNNPSNPWPQLGGSGTNPNWGCSLPPNAATTFYTNLSQFSTTATDKTLSNFYYQMSQHNASPLQMLAVNFPTRVNVTATTANNYSGWGTYNRMVLDRIRTDYQASYNL